ncbi:MAG TPA: thioesterase family protein [Desulfobacterales bacterium]|nr:thioesterase family protein [Desulfobacterales bacterium]
MPAYQTTYRVIYGDTDNMGYGYYANYLRWFEIGRAEMLRSWGLSYKMIETQGIFLPASEARCKYMHPVKYDDLLIIETSIDTSFKGAVKFDYRIRSEDGQKIHAVGFTKHACIDRNGKVVRPPRFLMEIIEKNTETE